MIPETVSVDVEWQPKYGDCKNELVSIRTISEMQLY